MTKEQPNEGWWWPLNARKAHYMVSARSLCGKWGTFLNPDYAQGNDDSPDNCARCRRLLAKRKAERSA